MLWKKSFLWAFVVFSLCTLSSVNYATAAEEFSPEYVLEENKLYKKTGDKKELMEKVEPLKVTGAEFIAYPVSKKVNAAMDGSAMGIYFFKTDGTFEKFIKFDDEDFATHLTDIVFSPTAEYLVIDQGTSPERGITFYNFANATKVFTTTVLSPYYWVDGTRFFMTTMDENTFKREGANYGSGTPSSIALYNVANRSLNYLRRSSSLADYFIQAYNDTNKTYSVREVLVPTPEDWKDATKYQETITENVALPE